MPIGEAWVGHSATQYRRVRDGSLIDAPNAQPAASSAAQPFPSRAVMLYHLIYSNSTVNNLFSYYFPSNINCVSLAFFFGDPPAPAGYTAAGQAAFTAGLRQLRASGVRIGISLGGAGNPVNLANRTGVVNSVMSFSNNQCPIDYLDIDLEGSASPGQADCVAIAQALQQQRGPNFMLTMAPSGGPPVSVYRPIAKALQDIGALGMIGQQYYDATVDEAAMMSSLAGYISAGITQDHLSIGMMVDNRGTPYWDVNTCVSRVTRAKQTYPDLRGGYLWVEKTQTAALDWANRVGNLLKG